MIRRAFIRMFSGAVFASLLGVKVETWKLEEEGDPGVFYWPDDVWITTEPVEWHGYKFVDGDVYQVHYSASGTMTQRLIQQSVRKVAPDA